MEAKDQRDSLAVMPKSEQRTEFFKVLDWMLARSHDADRFDMARKRINAALSFNTITNDDAEKARDIVDKAENV